MADKLEFEVSVPGTPASAAAVRDFSAAVRSSGDAAAQSDIKLQQIGGSIGRLTVAVGALAPQLGMMGGAAEQATSGLGRLVSAIGSGGAAGGLVAVLGLATSGVVYMISEMRKADEEAARWANTISRMTIPALDELTRRTARQREAVNAANLREMNLDSSDVPLSMIHQRQAEQTRLRFQIQENERGGGDSDALMAMNRRMQSITSEIDRLRADRAQSEAEALAISNDENIAAMEAGAQAERDRIAASRRRGRGRGPSERDQRREGFAQIAGDTLSVPRYRSGSGEEIDLTDTIRQANDPSKNAATLADRQARADQARRQQQLSQEREWYQERARQRDAFYDDWAEKGATVGAALGDVLNAVASGQSTLLQATEQVFKQFMAQTAKSESIEAGKAFAKGIGALLIRPDAAAGFFAEGAAHLAVAAAAGGAQAIVAAGGSGGTAARPTRIDRGSSGGGGEMVVINMNAPSITAGTDAELGRTIARTVRRGNRRYGDSGTA